MGWRDRAQPVSSSWRDKAEPVSPVPGIAKSVVDSATLDADGNYVAKTSDGQTLRFTPQGQRILDAGEALDAMRGPGATFTEGALERGLSALHGASNSLTGKMAGGIARLRGEDPAAAEKNAMATVNPAVDAHPGYNIAGAVAPALLVPTSAAGAAGKGVPFATRALEAGAQALPSSFLNAYGHTTPDQSAGEQALQTAVGGTAGTVAGGVFGGAMAKGAQYLGDKAKAFARIQALRALDPSKRNITKLQNLGVEEPLADDLLQLIRPWTTKDTIAEDVASEGVRRGQQLGNVVGAIDDASGGATVLPDVVADRMKTDVLSPLGGQVGTGAARARKLAQDQIDSILEMYTNRVGPTGEKIPASQTNAALSLADAERLLKSPFADAAKKAAQSTDSSALESRDILAGMYRAAKSQNEDAADAIATALKPRLESGELVRPGDFKSAKDAYGRMAEAQRILEENGAPKSLANRALSPSDYWFGIATGQTYQPGGGVMDALKAPGQTLVGLAGSMAHKAIRERGNTTAAWAANSASPMMSKAGDVLAPYIGAASAKETSDAFADLSAYLGRPPKNKEEGADTHFTAGQSDQQWQKKNSPQ